MGIYDYEQVITGSDPEGTEVTFSAVTADPNPLPDAQMINDGWNTATYQWDTSNVLLKVKSTTTFYVTDVPGANVSQTVPVESWFRPSINDVTDINAILGVEFVDIISVASHEALSDLAITYNFAGADEPAGFSFIDNGNNTATITWTPAVNITQTTFDITVTDNGPIPGGLIAVNTISVGIDSFPCIMESFKVKTITSGLTDVDYKPGNVMVDSVGNWFVAGWNYTTAIEYTFLMKYNMAGVLQWQKSLMTGISGKVKSSTMDSNGDIIIGTTYHAYTNLFKYNAAGVVQWQYDVSTSDGVYPNSISTDAANNIYVLYEMGYGDIVERDGYVDTTIVKLNSAGVVQWQQRYYDVAIVGDCIPKSIKTTATGDSYIVGVQRGVPTALEEIYIIKLDTDGILLWQVLIPSNGNSETSVNIDSAGNVYTISTTLLDASVLSLCKLDSNGVGIWQTELVETSKSTANVILIDSSDDVYVVGDNCSVIKFNPAGTVIWQGKMNSIREMAGVALINDCNIIGVVDEYEVAETRYNTLAVRIPTDGSGIGEVCGAYTFDVIAPYTENNTVLTVDAAAGALIPEIYLSITPSAYSDGVYTPTVIDECA